jgi:hypothetical protein
MIVRDAGFVMNSPECLDFPSQPNQRRAICSALPFAVSK